MPLAAIPPAATTPLLSIATTTIKHAPCHPLPTRGEHCHAGRKAGSGCPPPPDRRGRDSSLPRAVKQPYFFHSILKRGARTPRPRSRSGGPAPLGSAATIAAGSPLETASGRRAGHRSAAPVRLPGIRPGANPPGDAPSERGRIAGGSGGSLCLAAGRRTGRTRGAGPGTRRPGGTERCRAGPGPAKGATESPGTAVRITGPAGPSAGLSPAAGVRRSPAAAVGPRSG